MLERHTVLERNNDIVMIALNTIYDFESIIKLIEDDLKTKKFNGFLVFDYLLSCVSRTAIDRFIGYKVINGKVSYNEKYIFLNTKYDLNSIGDKHFMNVDSKIIEASLLSTKSKETYIQNKSIKL
ncbi:MAG: hypothetical protein WC219_01395 [Acholeplasmataceae bacterium]